MRDLADVVAEEVLAQLEDLLKGQPEALRQALGGPANEGVLFRTHEPQTEPDDYTAGAIWIEVLPFREQLDAPALMAALRAMADTAQADHWVEDEDGEAPDSPAEPPTAAPASP